MLSGIPVIYGIDPHNESTSADHQLGSVGVDNDGRRFRYAKFGASVTAGELLQCSVEDTGDQSLLVAAGSIGDLFITTAGTVTVTANQYADGYVLGTAEGGTGNGILYRIKSHPAATGAVVKLTLYEPLKVAITAATQVDIVKNPFDSVIQNPTTASGTPAGVAMIAGTSGSFGWIQVGGAGLVKADASGAITVGAQLTASNQTAGCCEDGDSHSQGNIGVAITGIAQAEFGLAQLNIS